MQVLEIRWQRLIDEVGATCDRCGATGAEVEDAVEKLRRSLKELGIEVTLKKESLGREEFSQDPLQSNRIFIAGAPLESWIAASAGKSKCCSSCGDADCRTLTAGGKTYEAVPSFLIVKAGLVAAAELLERDDKTPCCPGGK